MKLVNTIKIFDIEFSDTDVAIIRKCSEHHYDPNCKQFGIALCNELKSPVKVVRLTFSELDKLCKITSITNLHGQFKNLLNNYKEL